MIIRDEIRQSGGVPKILYQEIILFLVKTAHLKFLGYKIFCHKLNFFTGSPLSILKLFVTLVASTIRHDGLMKYEVIKIRSD